VGGDKHATVGSDVGTWDVRRKLLGLFGATNSLVVCWIVRVDGLWVLRRRLVVRLEVELLTVLSLDFVIVTVVVLLTGQLLVGVAERSTSAARESAH
jgi:hypothetical protein